jgi:outer membrane protein assembly factor BamB
MCAYSTKQVGRISMKLEIPILIVLLLSAALSPMASQLLFISATSLDNWPMFHNDLSHSGYSTSSSSPATPSLLWNFTTNGPVSASPTIVDDRVYVGSLRGIAYCLNAKDGNIIWNYTVHARTQGLQVARGPAIGSSMAVVNGYVYFGCYDRNVYCLDAATGEKVWNFTTRNSVESSPAIYGGKVYIGSWDGSVYCLDAVTGAKIWNFTTGSLVESSPAIADDKVYVGSVDGYVYCLDALTGERVWSYQTGSLVQSSPAVVGGHVFIGSEDKNVYCLDALTGTKVWNYTLEGWVDSSPAVANGYIYVGCTKAEASDNDLPSSLYCLDSATGNLVWNFTMKGGASYSSPAIAGDLVYIGDFYHDVYCFNATSGAEIWSCATGAHVNSSPAIAGGNVYIGSWDYRVYAFGVTSESQSKSFATENIIIAAAIAVVIIALATFVVKQKRQKKFN